MLSLFFKEEMELSLIGLNAAGKTSLVNVIAVRHAGWRDALWERARPGSAWTELGYRSPYPCRTPAVVRATALTALLGAVLVGCRRAPSART